MEDKKNVLYSSKDGKFNDKTQIKMWETEIIMHMQTLQLARKNPKANEKSIAQVEKAINENLMKIRQIDPNYILPHSEDNVDSEIHSGFNKDAKENEHVEDTLGLESQYSGEKKYKEIGGDADIEEKTKRFLKSLQEKTERVETVPNNGKQEANALFDKLHETAETPEKSIDEVFDDVHRDKSLNTDNVKAEVNVEYDLVPLPSNGECYRSKKKRLSVSYLTAYDENMITSPNLYEGNLISEFLLKNKIMDKDINIMDLTVGDADAILVWLRKTGYGTDYPVTVTDSKTGTEFNATINLDDIKMVDFKLKGDENGYFDYHCDICGADIKFRFLTLADSKAFDNKIKLETEDVRKNYISTLIAKVKHLITDDKELDSGEKDVLYESFNIVDKWTASKSDKNYQFANTVTDSLERLIVSVNGNDNREYIKKFIARLPALDSLKFRKYVNDNEPRMDFTVEIEKPANLGGGWMKTFLDWNKYVFTNTPVV